VTQHAIHSGRRQDQGAYMQNRKSKQLKTVIQNHSTLVNTEIQHYSPMKGTIGLPPSGQMKRRKLPVINHRKGQQSVTHQT